MKLEDKISRACRAINRLESSGRKLNAHRRRRCARWIKVHSKLEQQNQREFRIEMWESIFAALKSYKMQQLIIFG